MNVIGVVGLPASGKGEFSKIAEGLGIPVVVMGDVIRNAVKKAGLPPSDENLGAMANRLRAERGMDAIAILCVDAEKSRRRVSCSSTASGAMRRSGSFGSISPVSGL